MNQSDHEQNAQTLTNQYDSRSGFRTATGVLSSLLLMGIPVGMTEFLRGGGDKKVALISGVAAVFGLIIGFLSIRGTMKD